VFKISNKGKSTDTRSNNCNKHIIFAWYAKCFKEAVVQLGSHMKYIREMEVRDIPAPTRFYKGL
jgi:hypothetical protein